MKLTAIGIGVLSVLGLQGQSPIILDVDVSNTTAYYYDNFDPSRFGVNPNSLTNAPATNFFSFLNFGDLTAINGEPFRGTWVARVFAFRMKYNTHGRAVHRRHEPLRHR